MTDKVNEVLEKAIEILDDDRWGQGAERNYDPGVVRYRYCAVGAIRTAAGWDWSLILGMNEVSDGYDGDAFIEAYRRANAVVTEETFRRFPSIVGYNDATGRTAEDVRLMLKRAIRT